LSSTSPEPSGAQSRTRIIAHRGASGYLPEHTAVGKTLAYGLGADFIEQDLVATRDGALVVLHDLYLEDVSDVAAEFPGRQRADGHYYVVDFMLAELERLSLMERRQPGKASPRFPGRFPYALPAFRVQGFEDEIRLISGLNATTGRRVGIYPEIKSPAWHATQAGIDLTDLVYAALERTREIISGPVFVQSFDGAALRRLKDELGASWPLVRLLDRNGAEALVDDSESIAAIRAHAIAVGLPYETLIESGDGRLEATKLARTLNDAGLLLHPYTLRRDVAPPAGLDYSEILHFLIRELEVDAIFCDHPDDAIAIRDGSAA
jgi:glycerophosphoryl diester phosphodiesterase